VIYPPATICTFFQVYCGVAGVPAVTVNAALMALLSENPAAFAYARKVEVLAMTSGPE
jgi:hypothetical protein